MEYFLLLHSTEAVLETAWNDVTSQAVGEIILKKNCKQENGFCNVRLTHCQKMYFKACFSFETKMLLRKLFSILFRLNKEHCYWQDNKDLTWQNTHAINTVGLLLIDWLTDWLIDFFWQFHFKNTSSARALSAYIKGKVRITQTLRLISIMVHLGMGSVQGSQVGRSDMATLTPKH